MKGKSLCISILAVVLISTVACKNEEKKEMDDYMEEEMMRKLARDMLFPTTPAATTCPSTQVAVRFSNASGTSQTFALFSAVGCAIGTKTVSVTGSTPVATATMSAFKCSPLSANGYYPGTDNGVTCGGTAFALAAGNSYTITSFNGAYSYDAVY